MIHFTDATGLLASAVALAAAISRAPGVSRLRRTQRAWLLGTVLVAVLLPLGKLPLAAYLRGAIGDLSITSLILLCAGVLRALRGGPPPADRNWLLALVAATAAAFYPLALGWGIFDPYRMGFGSDGFLACLLALAVAALLARVALVAVTLALAVLAWSAGWYESPNLWDYLIDPLVAAYAVLALVAQGVRAQRRRAG